MKKLKLSLAVICVVFLLANINASAAQTAGEPPIISRAQLQGVIDAQEKHTPELIKDPLVLGTGVSVDSSGRGVIKVYTRSPGVRNVPLALDGYAVIIEVTGEFVALQKPKANKEGGGGGGGGKGGGGGGGGGKGGGGGGGGPFDRLARHRPAPLGVSTGHPDITAGTIGARVTDDLGNVYALSNNHVFANVNAAVIGDNVLQPGAFDGGVDPVDAFGMLWDFEPLGLGALDVNLMDAAIALTSEAELGNVTGSDGYGMPKSETVAAAVNLNVMKYGRTTGQTSGVISDINVYAVVDYGAAGILSFDGQILISGTGFSAGGDSGSLIVVSGGKFSGADALKPVGLLFAGSSTTTLANPIDLVLDRFGVTIDGQ